MQTNYFGFQRDPFSQAPDSQFFYQSVSHQRAFDGLCTGLSKGERIFLLTGDAGTGKTSLLRKVGARFESDARVIFLQYSNCTGLEYLLEFICSELRLGPRNKSKGSLAVSRLLNRFFQGYRGKKAVMVVIDDAHLIDDDVLEDFLRLFGQWSASAGRVQLVLAGLASLETKYEQASSQIRGGVISCCFRLTRLDTNEVRGYINQRFNAIGYAGKSLFPDETINRVVECTRGIPRLINTVCGSALYVAGMEKRPVVTPDLVTDAEDQCLLEKNSSVNLAAQEIGFPPVYRQGIDDNQSYTDFKAVNSDISMIRVDTSNIDPEKSDQAPISLEELTPVSFVSEPGIGDRQKANRWSGLFSGKKVTKPTPVALLMTGTILVAGLMVFLNGGMFSGTDSRRFQPQSNQLNGSVAVAKLPALEKQAIKGGIKQAQPLEGNATKEKLAALQRSPTNKALDPGAQRNKEFSPDPTSDKTAEGHENRISELRVLAEQQMRDRDLTLPEDANALKTYRQILELSPGDKRAQAGIDKIRQTYTQWARGAAERGRWEKSHAYYSKSLSIAPVDMAVLREFRKVMKKRRRYYHDKEDPWAVKIQADLLDNGQAKGEPNGSPGK